MHNKEVTEQQKNGLQNNQVNLSDSSSDDDSSWQCVSNRKRSASKSPLIRSPKRQQLDVRPSTSNRFVALADDVEEDDVSAKEAQPPKPPPIFIPNVDDIGKMVIKISKIIPSSDFYYKSLRDGQVRLNIKTVDCYRKVVKYFDNMNIKYHTYQLKQERAYTVVLKGLHPSTPVEDIKAKLLVLGHQVRSIRNIISRSSKQPLPMFFVDLDPNSNNKDIYNLREFDNAIIQVEAPKKFNDIVQCFRCQEFGHTKTYCRKPFRCVKCGLTHSTVECSKLPNTPPQCVHCLKNHTASYKGCEVYQKLINKKEHRIGRNVPEPQNYNNNYFFTPPTQNDRLTYAQVAGTNDGVNNVLQKIESMLEKQIELTSTLMNMMSMLISKLCK